MLYQLEKSQRLVAVQDYSFKWITCMGGGGEYCFSRVTVVKGLNLLNETHKYFVKSIC